MIRLINGLAIVNKALEQFNCIVNENDNARYRGIATQLYTTKQDIEDALREGWVDAPVAIASAPNLPNNTTQNNTTTGANPIGANPTGNIPTGNTPNGNIPNGNLPTGQPNAGMNVNGNSVQPNVPVTNGAAVNATAFFDNLLKGATANNSDLADALNQITQGNGASTPQNFPF